VLVGGAVAGGPPGAPPRRIPRAVAMCSTALGTGLFIARAQGSWALRARPGAPAPVVTPWLVLTMTVGVATLTAKVLTMHPQYADALLAVGTTVCCVTLGACVLLDRGTTGARG
jgi:K+ transporter